MALYSVRKLAAECGLHKLEVSALIDSHGIRISKVGTSHVIEPSDLARLIRLIDKVKANRKQRAAPARSA